MVAVPPCLPLPYSLETAWIIEPGACHIHRLSACSTPAIYLCLPLALGFWVSMAPSRFDTGAENQNSSPCGFIEMCSYPVIHMVAPSC